MPSTARRPQPQHDERGLAGSPHGRASSPLERAQQADAVQRQDRQQLERVAGASARAASPGRAACRRRRRASRRRAARARPPPRCPGRGGRRCRRRAMRIVRATSVPMLGHVQATRPTPKSANTSEEPPALMNGSGIPLGGSRPSTTRDVDERLQHDRQRQARGEEACRTRRARATPRAGRARAAARTPITTATRAEQPELLADHREDEVAVGVGQVEQLLAAFHQADARDAAGADRDQALDDLVAGAPADRPTG